MTETSTTIDLVTLDPVAQACRKAIVAWVKRGHRLIAMSGEHGRGRTTVLRRVAEDLAAAPLVDCLGPQDIVDCTAELTFQDLLEVTRRDRLPVFAHQPGPPSLNQEPDDGLLPLPFVNSGRRRVVLLDTAERLRPATFDRLAELQRRFWKESGPLSLVVTITPELEARLVAVGEAQRLDVAGVIARLRPLSDGELSTVMRGYLATSASAGPVPIDDRWLEIVVGNADGNPLRALRMGRALAEGQALDPAVAGAAGSPLAVRSDPTLPSSAEPGRERAIAPPAYPMVSFTAPPARGRRRLRRAGLIGGAIAATLAALYGGLPTVQARVDRLLVLMASSLTAIMADEPSPTPAAVLQVPAGAAGRTEPTARQDRGEPDVAAPDPAPPPPVATGRSSTPEPEAFRTDAGVTREGQDGGSAASRLQALTTGLNALEALQPASETVADATRAASPTIVGATAGAGIGAETDAEMVAETDADPATETATETLAAAPAQSPAQSPDQITAQFPTEIPAGISTETLGGVRAAPSAVGTLVRRGEDGRGVPWAPQPATADPGSSAAGTDAVTTWLDRGERLLRLGDVAAARPFFRLAAEAGSGLAAGRVGLTYDPLYLAERGVVGGVADPRLALSWYQVGAAAGDAASAGRLQALAAVLKRDAAAGNAAAATALTAAGIDE